MADFNTTIGTAIGAPFLSNHPYPIDNRMVVENENGRLSIPWPVQYEGLLVYQKDTNLLYVCITVGSSGVAAEWAIVTTSNAVGASVFPHTGSADISGSLSITGPITITAPTGSDNLFLVRTTSDESKFVVNLEGVTVLGSFDTTPTPVDGGMFFSSSGDFYLGS